jgi:hypothetical protein
VQQVIPLPEAAELTVRLKKREAAVRVAKESNRDLTKYVITTPTSQTEPLPKRRAILSLVKALHAAGVPAATLAGVVPDNKLRSVPGPLEGDELWETFRGLHAQSPGRRKRWFVEDPLHEADETWVLFGNWGLNTEAALDALLSVAPDGYSYSSEGGHE